MGVFNALAKRILGSPNDRIVKTLREPVAGIGALEAELQKLSDEQLRAKTVEFRRRLAEGTDLDDLLPEAFAAVREAARRTSASGISTSS